MFKLHLQSCIRIQDLDHGIQKCDDFVQICGANLKDSGLLQTCNVKWIWLLDY